MLKGINLDSLFPNPFQNMIGCKRLDESKAKYSNRRYGDTIEIEGKPTGTISKIGRKFWTREFEFGKLSYQYCGSFPMRFQFIGNLSDIKNRIGNSVPPPIYVCGCTTNQSDNAWWNE